SFAATYLMVAAPASVLMIANGLSFSRHTAMWVVSAFAISGCLWVTMLQKCENRHEDYRTVCSDVIRTWHPGQAIVSVTGTYEGYSEATVRHYLRAYPEMLACTVDASRLLSDDPIAPDDFQVIYRDANYAWSTMEAIKEKYRLVSEDPPRARIQRMLFENPRSK